MGTISGSLYGAYTGTFSVDADWSATTEVDSNLSKVTVKVYINYYSIDIGERTCTCTVNGVTQTKTVAAICHSGSAAKKLAATFAFDVPHAADGSMAQCYIYAGFYFNLTSSSQGYIGTLGVSGTVALETIPRASAITSAAGITLGNNCAIKWTPASAAFRYRLEFALDNFCFETDVIHPNKTTEYTYTGALPFDDAARQITGYPPSETMRVTLTTYSDSGGTTRIGDASSAYFTVTVPENDATKPMLSISASPSGSPVEGIYIQGKSGISVSFSPDYKLGAEEAARTITVDGAVYTGGAVLTGSGDMSVKGAVKDSRGFYATDYEAIYVYPYSKPRVTNVVCERCDSDGNPDDSGSRLHIKATRVYATLGGRNACSLEYQINGGGWSELLGTDDQDDTVDIVPQELTGLSLKLSYTVQIRAVDTLGETGTVTVLIPTEDVDFHLRQGGKGAAFGGYAQEEELLDVHWDQRIRQNLTVDGAVNGLYIRGVHMSGRGVVIRIQTRFAAFSGGDARQVFLVFGSYNFGANVLCIAGVNNSGAAWWGGPDDFELVAEENGIIRLQTGETTATYGDLTIISVDDFSILNGG